MYIGQERESFPASPVGKEWYTGSETLAVCQHSAPYDFLQVSVE